MGPELDSTPRAQRLLLCREVKVRAHDIARGVNRYRLWAQSTSQEKLAALNLYITPATAYMSPMFPLQPTEPKALASGHRAKKMKNGLFLKNKKLKAWGWGCNSAGRVLT